MLVSDLISQSETLDLTGNSTSLSAKGSARREKLQQDLAAAHSNFFLQVTAGPAPGRCRCLLLSRKPRPAGGCPLRATCRERGNTTDPGLGTDDADACKHWRRLRERATEQAASDGGRWDLAFLLTLGENAPPTVFAPRPTLA